MSFNLQEMRNPFAIPNEGRIDPQIEAPQLAGKALFSTAIIRLPSQSQLCKALVADVASLRLSPVLGNFELQRH